MALEAAGDRGEDGGRGEDEPLPLEGVHPHDGGRLLVVADRAHVRADPRVDERPGGQDRRQGQREEEVVVRGGARRAEQERGGQAEVAARDLVLGGDEQPDGLGEGPGGEGQVDRAHPEAEGAEPVPDRGRDGRARGDADEDRHARVQDEEGRRVRADAGEGVVRQRELARVAGEEVPADREDHVVEARGQHVRVVLGRDPGQPREGGVGQHAAAEPAREGSQGIRLRGARRG